MIPPKPLARTEKVSLRQYLRLFRADILSAQPARLYHAWMAEFRTPFFRSYLCNDPSLVARVLSERPRDFPKSNRIGEGLRPLLGQSVFITNGAVWERQRRIIDPAFAGGRLHHAVPGIWAAAGAAATRLTEGQHDIEGPLSHAAADVIFRTLFSIPIEDALAARVYRAFQAYQRAQPLVNLAAFLPLPAWMPRLHRRATLSSAREIRALIGALCATRAKAIADGSAPDDLATKIMTTPDPETGQTFSTAEMVDQVAIFFLAGHETSASALSWALYLLATHPDVQDRVAAEVATLPNPPVMSDLSRLRLTRDVFRETLRLYPPVPMMVRENTRPEHMRGRAVRPGAQIVISPWHLHRHDRIWDNPDGFDPDRWTRDQTKASQRDGYLPFSAGPRVCTGAGFAMVEGVLMLAALLRGWQFHPVEGQVPVPVAHLTVRSKAGIWLGTSRRTPSA
jgi:cytochrome P450